MSAQLEKQLETLSPAQAARLMTVVHQIASAARAAYNIDVPLDDVAALVQVRDSVFHGEGGLDEVDISNCLYNLRQNSAVAREAVAQQEIEAEAARNGADTANSGDILAMLNSIDSPSARMQLARRYGIGVPEQARKPHRPSGASVPNAKPVEPARSTNEAVARMNAARKVGV